MDFLRDVIPHLPADYRREFSEAAKFNFASGLNATVSGAHRALTKWTNPRYPNTVGPVARQDRVRMLAALDTFIQREEA